MASVLEPASMPRIAPCKPQVVMCSWFYFWFWRNPTWPFSSLFPYLSPPLFLSFPWRTDPLRFQARCHKRQLNLALVFLCLFCVVVHFFWLLNACICCVRFSSFSILHQEIGFWKRLQNDLFCIDWGVKPQLNQAVNASPLSQHSMPRSCGSAPLSCPRSQSLPYTYLFHPLATVN